MTRFKIFIRNSDPAAHLAQTMTHFSPHLPSLLEGLALEWFKDQPTSSISCWEEIKLAFLGACSFYKDMNNKFERANV